MYVDFSTSTDTIQQNNNDIHHFKLEPPITTPLGDVCQGSAEPLVHHNAFSHFVW